MAGKGGRKKQPESKKKIETVVVDEEEKTFTEKPIEENPPVVSLQSPPSESELARNRLRSRWELACVINFLRVFKPMINSKLQISAVEIETALISPNSILSELHISLLKGILPVSKTLTGPDAWVSEVYKKVSPWWPWVAEGEFPIEKSHGKEISRYKELDPLDRLLILKALCEIRIFQDDAVRYINDALKEGTEVCTFRKNRIVGDGTGIEYWNDGDAVMGYRLYKEVTKVEFTPRKGKGRLTQPPSCHQWETLATNLEEYRQISDKLSSSDVVVEACVADIVKNEVVPALEEFQKKQERALKRQQKQVMLLSGHLNSYRIGGTRTCRNRKPVKYTFDDYDRSIDEAIQLNKKRKTTQKSKHKHNYVGDDNVNTNDNSLNNGSIESDTEDDKFRDIADDSESGDEDYDDKDDENDNDKIENDEDDNDNDMRGDLARFNKENSIIGPSTRATRYSQRKNAHLTRDVANLRRSKRITGNAVHPELKNRDHVELRKQRSHTSENDSDTVSDSDGGRSLKSSTDKMSDAGKESLDVLEGLLEESAGEENEESAGKENEDIAGEECEDTAGEENEESAGKEHEESAGEEHESEGEDIEDSVGEEIEDSEGEEIDGSD
ncbi:Ddt domain-containing protein ddr4 [Thalictrum thalictroides]|uniref:Ddt domain-containing protein ddr4 n=1 Tax=Thalictrum thalictroides TaxID=46969 RepID=A0A7J6XDQ2_THATH|nr:Ddt domain-containing protein ddr4 [Thalictrum thalictroides]